ncbi:MAG: hypothetical protein J6Y66_03050 [Bacteroidales bacterium]|nr:hypothetical protein [Bacteroidales bacterium]
MKKFLTVTALLALCLGAFAQNTGKDVLKDLEEKPLDEKTAKKAKPEKEFKVFEAQALAYLGFGWHLMDGAEFQKGLHKGNTEFFMNITEFDFTPAKFLTLSLGMDVKWDWYTPTPDYGFSMSGDNLVLGAAPAVVENYKSTLSTAAFTFPLGIKIRIGDLASITAGAEAVLNLPKNAKIKDKYAIGSMSYSTKETAGSIPQMGWNAYARVTFGGLLGLYARYYPQQPLIPTAPFGLTTVGLLLDLGSF